MPRPRQSRYHMLLATLLIMFETLLPTVVNAVIAATAIREAISVYSMAVAPCSFFIRRRKMDSIGISKGKERSLTGIPVHRSAALGTAEMIDTNAWGRYCPSLNNWMRYGNYHIDNASVPNAKFVSTWSPLRGC